MGPRTCQNFRSCLETRTQRKLRSISGSDDAEAECSCDLVSQSEGDYSLLFAFAFKLCATVWRPKYPIMLKSIAVRPYDILADELRNAQDELAQPRSDRIAESRDSVSLKLTAAVGRTQETY